MNLIKKSVASITQVLISLAALTIVIQVLFGKQFIAGDFPTNLMGLIQQIGNAGMIGLIVLAILVWIFSNSRDESGSGGM